MCKNLHQPYRAEAIHGLMLDGQLGLFVSLMNCSTMLLSHYQPNQVLQIMIDQKVTKV